ncbi:MAG: PAS domain-containing protein [Chloroflexi bacterium]|nr:PAS domain-containing protein [Chloroflexota bacterium]
MELAGAVTPPPHEGRLLRVLVSPGPLSAVVACGITAAVVIGAVGLTVLFQRQFNALSTNLLVLAVLVAAWYGGVRYGLIALVALTVAAPLIIFEPRFSLAIARSADWIRLGLFILVGLLSLALVGQLQRARADGDGSIAELREAARRRRFMSDVSALLASTLNVNAAMNRLASMAIPTIADYCVVTLVDEHGTQQEMALQHRDPERLQFVRRLQEEYPAAASEDVGVLKVMRTGEPDLVAEIPDSMLVEAAQSEEHLQLLRALQLRSVLFVPMITNGKTIGVLALAMAESGRSFTPEDTALAMELAGRAAVAIENARLYSDLEAADERFRLAEQGARTGSWSWDLGERVQWSESMEQIYGFAPGAYPGTFAAFSECVHPDDREQVAALVASAVESRSELDFEHRILLPDGTERWLYSRGRLVFDDEGNPTRMIGIGMDITARKHLALELEATTERLREANAAKDEFLGLVSHELRTPITTIYGNARVLHEHIAAIGPEDRDMALADIEHEAERLQRIIENMLILARFDATQDLDVEPMRMGEVATEIVAMQRRRHPERAMAIDAGSDLPIVMAQPTYIELVLSNLISNADKYSPPNERIDVRVSVADDEVQVRVLDRGSGLVQEEIEELFSPFYRANHTKALAGGMGIGLAVCKRVLEAQGCRIWASARDGGGSEFGFSLPVAEHAWAEDDSVGVSA